MKLVLGIQLQAYWLIEMLKLAETNILVEPSEDSNFFNLLYKTFKN